MNAETRRALQEAFDCERLPSSYLQEVPTPEERVAIVVDQEYFYRQGNYGD